MKTERVEYPWLDSTTDSVQSAVLRIVLEAVKSKIPENASPEKYQEAALDILEIIAREASDDNAMDLADWVAEGLSGG